MGRGSSPTSAGSSSPSARSTASPPRNSCTTCARTRKARGRSGAAVASTARDLGAMLREFGIKSGNVRMADGTQRKGYTRNKFLDAWRRYCPTVHPLDAEPRPQRGLSPAPAPVAVLAVPAVISQVTRHASKTATGAKTATRSTNGAAARDAVQIRLVPSPRPCRIAAGHGACGRDGKTDTPVHGHPSRSSRPRARPGTRRRQPRRNTGASAVPALTCACNGQDGQDGTTPLPPGVSRLTTLSTPTHGGAAPAWRSPADGERSRLPSATRSSRRASSSWL